MICYMYNIIDHVYVYIIVRICSVLLGDACDLLGGDFCTWSRGPGPHQIGIKALLLLNYNYNNNNYINS